MIATLSGIESLRRQLGEYYTPLRQDRIEKNRAFVERRDRIWKAMNEFAAANPGLPAVLLKSRLHAEIAEQFEPVVFPDSPFFFEMGVRPADNWGTPTPWSGSTWLMEQRRGICDGTPEWGRVWACHIHNNQSQLNIWGMWGVFDVDHHCIGYTRLLKIGVCGVIKELSARRMSATTDGEKAFLDAALQSCGALLRCAERFAEAAEQRLATEADPAARRFLGMIASAARRVPAEAPTTFHEALASLLFLREAMASLEGIGISVVGHIDRQLIDWYRRDIKEGRITEEEAGDLLARWMLYTDVKFHIEDNAWPETSTCIELGGCDEVGLPVFNELTRLVVETHHRNGFINPKLNCRFGSASPREYLELLAVKALAGHNHFAFLNDDVIIPALVKAGKTEAHARLYVNGGCQEPMVEGYEHSAGAYYYLNMARVLDLFLQPAGPDLVPESADEQVRAMLPTGSSAKDFEGFYSSFIGSLARVIRQGAAWAAVPGRSWREVHPCPLFSTSLAGCIENATDYTAGGAVYNPSGIALVGFGTVVDVLLAVKKAVFDERWCTMDELMGALKADWLGHENLRARCIRVPKYGHGEREADELAARVARDLGEMCRGIPNERDGEFQASLFVYYFNIWLSGAVRATPDGRRSGDWLSQGASPGRLRPVESLACVLESVGQIDFIGFPANAVVDVQLPIQTGSSKVFAAVLQSFAMRGGMTLQVNCVSPEELRDAQLHPEKHAGLTVRISGLSARFIALERSVQDEILARTMLQV